MDFNINFFIINSLLGIGLAVDAFSVSLANGLNEPTMKIKKMSFIAAIFAFFQFIMPLIGWICISTIAKQFSFLEKFIPWIALILLAFIGFKMLIEGLQDKCPENLKSVGFFALIIQGIATSIDALSVGFSFTSSNYDILKTLIACLIIGILTFFICFLGIFIGKKAGTRLAGKASILGGIILILIGLEIFITNIF